MFLLYLGPNSSATDTFSSSFFSSATTLYSGPNFSATNLFASETFPTDAIQLGDSAIPKVILAIAAIAPGIAELAKMI